MSKNEKRKTLTKAEMAVMQILWTHAEPLSIKRIIEFYEEPRPAYTTIATFLRILYGKDFVEVRKGQGKQYLYTPKISRAQYTRNVLEDVKDELFCGSASSLITYFLTEEKLSEAEIREILELVQPPCET